MNLVPIVIEKTNLGERSYDIYSRLLKDRIVIINGEINDNSANNIVAQLLYLDSINHNEINVYINSPGGVVTSGLAMVCLKGYKFTQTISMNSIPFSLSCAIWLSRSRRPRRPPCTFG